jgi:hypothetical protein
VNDFASEFIASLPEETCGYTLDYHRGDSRGPVVQWLWAAPIQLTSAERAGALLRRAEDLGFHSIDVAPFSAHLPTSAEVLPACPFQPDMCAGEHSVVSGSGTIASR